MKRLLLVLAALVLLTGATVPSFADGNPWPKKPSCPATGCP